MKDHLVAAFALPASGPGWSNTPVVAVVQAADLSLRLEWIQPEQQTDAMVYVYPFSAKANAIMSREAARILGVEMAR